MHQNAFGGRATPGTLGSSPKLRSWISGGVEWKSEKAKGRMKGQRKGVRGKGTWEGESRGKEGRQKVTGGVGWLNAHTPSFTPLSQQHGLATRPLPIHRR